MYNKACKLYVNHRIDRLITQGVSLAFGVSRSSRSIFPPGESVLRSISIVLEVKVHVAKSPVCRCLRSVRGQRFAQYRAGIQGTVLDPQNTAISGATLTLTSKETGRTNTVTTDEAGVYNFLSLPPGRYTLTAEARIQEKDALRSDGKRGKSAGRKHQPGTRRCQASP